MRKTSIGGQAVMEGVMIMGREKACMAVRRKDGTISTEERDRSTFTKTHKWATLPIIRGCVNLVLQMKLGYGMLMKSATFMEQDEMEDIRAEEAKAKAEKAAKKDGSTAKIEAGQDSTASEKAADIEQTDNTTEASNIEQSNTEDTQSSDTATAESTTVSEKTEAEKEESSGGLLVYIGAILGVALAIGLFFVIPSVVTSWVLPRTSPFVSLFEGLIRIALLVGYMYACSLMKEMYRVFQYHGAEHKVIHCYEHELEPTPENAAKFSTVHPSCGTSYIFLVMLVSIVVFSFIGRGFSPVMRVVLRIGLLPLVAGLAYEVLKLAARSTGILARIVRAPGLLLQRLTTKQPDDDMLEVAAKAFYMAAEADGEI